MRVAGHRRLAFENGRDRRGARRDRAFFKKPAIAEPADVVVTSRTRLAQRPGNGDWPLRRPRRRREPSLALPPRRLRRRAGRASGTAVRSDASWRRRALSRERTRRRSAAYAAVAARTGWAAVACARPPVARRRFEGARWTRERGDIIPGRPARCAWRGGGAGDAACGPTGAAPRHAWFPDADLKGRPALPRRAWALTAWRWCSPPRWRRRARHCARRSRARRPS